MTMMLPILALVLLCLLQARAEVPTQPDFSAEKVTAQGAHPSSPAWAGGAVWGRVPVLHPQAQLGTLRDSLVLVLSCHQGSFQETVDACEKLLVLARASSGSTAGTWTPGAMMAPRMWCFPREHG